MLHLREPLQTFANFLLGIFASAFVFASEDQSFPKQLRKRSSLGKDEDKGEENEGSHSTNNNYRSFALKYCKRARCSVQPHFFSVMNLVDFEDDNDDIGVDADAAGAVEDIEEDDDEDELGLGSVRVGNKRPRPSSLATSATGSVLTDDGAGPSSSLSLTWPKQPAKKKTKVLDTVPDEVGRHWLEVEGCASRVMTMKLNELGETVMDQLLWKCRACRKVIPIIFVSFGCFSCSLSFSMVY